MGGHKTLKTVATAAILLLCPVHASQNDPLVWEEEASYDSSSQDAIQGQSLSLSFDTKPQELPRQGQLRRLKKSSPTGRPSLLKEIMLKKERTLFASSSQEVISSYKKNPYMPAPLSISKTPASRVSYMPLYEEAALLLNLYNETLWILQGFLLFVNPIPVPKHYATLRTK